MTFTHWFEYFQRSSYYDGAYAIGEEAWNAAKADGTPPDPQHGREPKEECKDCVFYHKLVPGNCVSVSACKHQQREPEKVKPLAQYLDEYIEHEVELGNVEPTVAYMYAYDSWQQLLEQALDAYKSTEQVKIRIERV